ncbi:hypothetical protein MRS44_016962 [Fusarium solani]|uniref:uncharacterized protein n=1 Tax=Fusarium solani TaxID=169388 RepID=UPI0032C4B0DA|nr:hypothetical protein MRS44_016962 [Fusarium solani]
MDLMHQEIQLSLDQYSRLEKLHLHFNLPEQAIICTLCGFALTTGDDRVGRHLGEKHHVPKGARQKLNALANSLQLPGPKTLPKRPDGSAPHPHLQILDGKACRHCGLRSTSLTVLSRHIRKLHNREVKATISTGKHWLRDHIVDNLVFQSWTLDITRAWIVTPPRASAQRSKRSDNRPLQPVPDPIQRFADQLLHKERTRSELHSADLNPPTDGDVLSTQALLTNWMRRTGWDRTLEGADCRILISLSSLPVPSSQPLYLGMHRGGHELSSSATDENRLLSIVAALDRLFDQCGETVRFTDVSVRRWLRSRFMDRPYKAPFELVSQSNSERTYRNEFKRCICFWLRIWRLPRAISRAITGRTFSTHQRRMLEELWLDSCWTPCDNEDENAENAYAGSALWLRQENLGSEAGQGEEGEEEEEEEEEDDGSEFSESEDTAGDALYGECSSDEEYGSDSQWYRVSESRNGGQGELQPGSHRVPSRETDNSCDPSVDAVLRFCYEMVTEHFEDGRASSALLVYFSAVRGLSRQEGNEYLRPARYTPILSRLIYCTRLIFLEAILPLRAHTYAGFAARPRYGQLAALNAVRVDQMCDGTMSPLGEFLSLLAYGLTLQRSEGPAWHFDWSEDGQTISWDGDTRLSMGQFRSLAHEAFRQATVQSRRLMYDFDPEDPQMGSLRDRLSNTTPGYSFLTDPHNGLGELYLTVFMRACTAPVDGLLQTRHGDGQGSWDVDAAQAYLHGHDTFLKNLMVLEQLDSGQAARVSELLTLEQTNTRSRLRGIGIFGGQMFSITRHNKARLTTNREFQVARHEPDRTLIFTPISRSTGWTTKVFTEELKRLSRDALGTEMEIGVRLYRQLSIAITERHVRGALPTFNRFDDVTEAADPDVAFAWQSGHRPMQRHLIYGLDGAFPDKLQPSLLRLYARCSEKWHSFLMIGPEAPPTNDIASVRSDTDTILPRQNLGQGTNAKKRKRISISSPQTTSQTSLKRPRRGLSNTELYAA